MLKNTLSLLIAGVTLLSSALGQTANDTKINNSCGFDVKTEIFYNVAASQTTFKWTISKNEAQHDLSHFTMSFCPPSSSVVSNSGGGQVLTGPDRSCDPSKTCSGPLYKFDGADVGNTPKSFTLVLNGLNYSLQKVCAIYKAGSECCVGDIYGVGCCVPPPCSISGGPASVCPNGTSVFSGPAGPNLSYQWSITGNGSIEGANNQQSVTVKAGASCGAYTLKLRVANTTNSVDCPSKECEQTVEVTDTEDPTIQTPEGADKNLGCNPTMIDANFSAPVFGDNCGLKGVTTEDVDGGSGCTKTRTRTWTAEDNCGNKTSVSQTLTWTADTQDPTVQTPEGADESLGCSPGDINSNFDAPVFTDNCGLKKVTSEDVDGGSGCTKTRTRTWTAEDNCGNKTSVSQTLTWAADTEDPTLQTPEGADENLGCNPGDINSHFDAPVFTDNCGLKGVTTEDVNGGSGCTKTRTRTWTAEDHCGHKASVSQTLTWTEDTQKPMITCAVVAAPNCGETPTFNPPIVSDNCGGTITPQGGNPSTTTNPDGSVTWTKTWTATDACGNQSSCTQTITIPACLNHIFPTGTTCENFKNQDVAPLESLCFKQSGGKVTNASSPGAWFYYAYVEKPAGVTTLSIKLAQSNDGVIQGLFTTNEIKVWTSNCTQITRNGTISYADPSQPVITLSGLSSAPQTYVVSVKYNSNSIVGNKVTGNSSVYNFSTFYGTGANPPTIPVPGSTETITAQDCQVVTSTSPAISNTDLSKAVTPDIVTTRLSVKASPNPYGSKVRFVVKSPVSGKATLEIFNSLGQKVSSVFQGAVQAGVSQSFEYNVPESHRTSLIYVLRVGNERITGKLLHSKE
ncbi:hypothetical protein EXU57_15035 [Segetibacter sp. 3557_3]|uniref:HYR-like domain-containing protein n=1 Tax=Segetibacter sp. 3557_3 TaxID=2547429 RepID=UPI00105857E1|nr:hypothetical protein [Segetibacter sp. 3557_3]TDH24648.1 hypothetical protein EXU57_15035 [Segetibacter sp. 3557_3]